MSVTQVTEKRVAKTGDIVGYVLNEGNDYGRDEVRPAIVIFNWNGGIAINNETKEVMQMDEGCLQLQVFTDGDGGGLNDGLPNVIWKTSVNYDEDKSPGTWHWLEDA